MSLPTPFINADSSPYWSAAANEKLVLRKCRACRQLHFMPRYQCPSCWSDDLEWIESSGRGTVHSFTIVRRAANVLGAGALDVQIGDAVRVTFESRGDGGKIPQFALVAAGSRQATPAA